MKSLKNNIIGEFWDQGYVEALIPGNRSSLRVCIRVPIGADYSARLRNADTLLPALIADIGAVEVIATEAVKSDAPSKVFDIWIEPDGTASYTCGFFEGEMTDELVIVERSQQGILSFGG